MKYLTANRLQIGAYCKSLRLLSELRVPFDHIGSHVAPTGAAFGFGVAYLLFLLMFLSMIAEIFFVALRALI